jgi:predicted transcriptional regulator
VASFSRGKGHHRSLIEIVADILEIARNGAQRTRIMYLGNFSFKLLEKYLDMLGTRGLLQQANSVDGPYVVTEKGQRFLEDYYELERYFEVVESKRRLLERTLNRPLTG